MKLQKVAFLVGPEAEARSSDLPRESRAYIIEGNNYCQELFDIFELVSEVVYLHINVCTGDF